MKNILLVANEFGFTMNAVRFALEVARADGSLLHGVFVQPPRKQEELDYLFPNDYRLTGQDLTGESYRELDLKLMEANVALFRNECEAAGVGCYADPREQVALRELLARSAFADLLILDADADVGPYALKDLLAQVRCPVCLVPQRAVLPRQVVLCYDGSDSGLYALKMYAYLLPQWRSLPTVLLTVQPEGGDPLPEALDEWLAQHFTEVRTEVVQGNVRRELVNALGRYGGGVLAVLGSYGRTAVSRFLQQSTADVLLRETGACLFVAHM